MNDDDREELGYWDGYSDGWDGNRCLTDRSDAVDSPYNKGYAVGYPIGFAASERIKNV